MKNNFKKIIVGIFTLAILFVGQGVFASTNSGIWNTAPNDCPDINIANYTTGVGYGDPCWTGTNISANPGETINVRIYYHNTSNTTATNTHIKLNAPSGSNTNHSFTAQIISPQGNLYSGPVTVTIPTSQILTFGSTRWYPNQTQTPATFLNGQDGSEVIESNGLYIGNIAPGWSTQGSVVVSFHVSNTQTSNCSISYFTANPQNINSGQHSVLNWNAPECTQTKIYAGNNLIGTFGQNGPLTVYPTITTSYTLKAYFQGVLKDTENVTVNVNQNNPIMTGNIDASISTCIIPSGGSTCAIPFAWSTQNPVGTSSITNNGTTVATGNNGNQTFNVHYGPQSYYLYNNSILLDQANVQTYCTDNTSWNGYNCAPVVVDTCSINNFSAIPTIITQGESSMLIWNTSNCAKVVLSGGSLSSTVASSGSKTVYPTETTTYTLKAYDQNNVLKDTKIATVGIKMTTGCAIKSFTAYPDSINQGGHSTLNWTTVNCKSAKIQNLGFVSTSGSKTVYPTQTTTYTLTAFDNTGRSISRAVTVTVNDIIPAGCSINNFTANPTSINQGETSLLVWNTSNCMSANISNLNFLVPVSGTQIVYPTQTTTYTLTVYGFNGEVRTKNVTVYVNSNNNNCSISYFYSDPSSIDEGESSILRWETNNCANVSIDGIGSVANTGSKIVWPTDTKTYILKAYGQSSYYSVTEQTTVYVNEDNNSSCSIDSFTADDTNIDDGDSAELRWRTSNCDRVKITDLGYVNEDDEENVYPTEDTTYVLTAYDYNGYSKTESIRIYVDEDNNSSSCSIDSFTADDKNINEGDSVELRWRTTRCDDVNISNIGYVDEDGEETVYPRHTTTYTLRAYRNGNSRTKSITINVGNNDWYQPPVYNSNVVTTIATNISQNSAQLNGLITNTNYVNVNTYFEYGTSVGMGARTASRPTSGNTNFSEYLTNLSPNTIYYFRAMSEGSNGISQGAIEVFRTLGNVGDNTQIIRQVVYQGTTVTGTDSPIMLQIQNRYQTISIGDIIDYTVYYKNIGKSTLVRPMVQVFLPKGITPVNTSRGTYSENDRTLSVPLEDLSPGAEGYIYLQARVDSFESNLAQIVTTAVLIYTNPNGAQENAMAYVLNNPRTNLLGASAFFGNIFGLSLIGWLLLIIFILLLVLIARSFFRPRVVSNQTHTTTFPQ